MFDDDFADAMAEEYYWQERQREAEEYAIAEALRERELGDE